MKKWLFLILFLFLYPLHCDVTWTTPVTLSNPGANAQDPQVTVDVNGNGMVVWIENGTIQFSYQPFGGNWSAPASISNTGTASSPRIGIDGSGNVTAIWIDGGIVYTSLYQSGSWSAISALSDAAGGASEAAIAVAPNGNTVVVWTRNSSIEAITKVSSSWGLVFVLSASYSDSPQVTVSPIGKAVAIWHSTVSGADTIMYASSAVGANWEAAQNITANNVNAISPKIAMDQYGNAYAAWFQFEKPLAVYSSVQIFTSILFESNNLGWSTPTVVGGVSNRDPNDLILCIKSDAAGNQMILWSESLDGISFAVYSAISQAAGPWVGKTAHILQSYYAYEADFGMTSLGHALFASMYSAPYDMSSVSIMARTNHVAGYAKSAWTFPQYLSSYTTNAYPKVAAEVMGNQVNGAIVWITSNGINHLLQVSTGSYPVVTPPSNIQITQQVNDLHVFLEYYNTITWSASPDPDIQSYAIYRNGLCIAIIEDITNLQIEDHNNSSTTPVTYGIAAVNTTKNQSATITATYP